MKTMLAVLALSAATGCATGSATAAPAAPLPVAWHAERSGTTHTLYDIGCLTASHCFAVGDAGTLLATTDAGRVWHREASPTRAPLYRIACAPPVSCYAIARPNTILV